MLKSKWTYPVHTLGIYLSLMVMLFIATLFLGKDCEPQCSITGVIVQEVVEQDGDEMEEHLLPSYRSRTSTTSSVRKLEGDTDGQRVLRTLQLCWLVVKQPVVYKLFLFFAIRGLSVMNLEMSMYHLLTRDLDVSLETYDHIMLG